MAIDRMTANRLIEDAVNRVWNTWGSYIPGGFRGDPSRFFVIHMNEASLRVPFTDVWNSLFKNVVQSTEPADTVALPGGFVTPELNRTKRKIHVNIGAGEYDWVGLFVHEYIHWLSHENFYPKFYKSIPGKTNDVVEGATDYLMLRCFHGYADGLTPAALQVYQQVCSTNGIPKIKKAERAAYNWKGQYTDMRNWVKADPLNEFKLANFVFNGQEIAIPV